MRNYKHWIDGEPVAPSSGAVIERRSPADGRLLATFAAGDANDVDAAVAAARREFHGGSWRASAGNERAAVLSRLADLIDADSERLAQIESEETGKTITAARGEIGYGVDLTRYAAAIAALNGPQDVVRDRARLFQRRRDLVVGALNAIPGLSCRRPEGAFYAYPGCSGVIGAQTRSEAILVDDRAFADYLLDWYVAVVPGSCFGLAPFFRISYATSEAALQTALERIAAACQALHYLSGNAATIAPEKRR